MTLISRSYAESNPRTGTAETSLTFTVKGESKNLDVPLYQQSDDDTCGPASARMILAYYGISVTESDITKYLKSAGMADFTVVAHLTNAINHFLSENGKSIQYQCVYVGEEECARLIKKNIMAGYPSQIPIESAPKPDPYFHYDVDGHYVVVKGIDGSDVKINDPYNPEKMELRKLALLLPPQCLSVPLRFIIPIILDGLLWCRTRKGEVK